uniref:Integrase catalytic domain-containing protein n=1 Tax=Bracon brevicornis TaxID=1563983 RepID=A0A6V7M0N1_9HYME
MIEIQSIRKADGITIQRVFEDVIVHRYGTPEVLLTGNGTEFANQRIQELSTSSGIRHMTTPSYQAQANPVERVHRVLKSMIVCFIGQDHRE